MHITKRPAVASDTELARSVHHRAYHEVVVRQYGLWDEEAQDELFAAAWSAAAHEIIFCDDLPCGYMCVEDRDGDIHLCEIVIDPEFQGKGVGTNILGEVIEYARMRQVPVRLRTHLMNRAAALYRRLGFQECGRTNSHVLMEWKSG